jgi:itaconate CoA-transferase
MLDLASPAGRDRLAELLGDADVLVQNLKPGALAKLGFGTEALRDRYPALITCSISGYGETGPLASRKAYDLLIQAESGLSSITGGPEGPARVGISIVDIATGATAHAAILEALIARGRSGRGADIAISMFDVMADWLTVPLLHEEGRRPPRRAGLSHPSIAPYGVFVTREGGQILISIQSDREWAKFCAEFLADPSLVQDTRFVTNVARVRNRAETDRVVGEAFARLERSDAIAALNRADVAFAELNDMAALSRHPHLRRITVEAPSGPVSFPAPGPIVAGEIRLYGPVPALGQVPGSGSEPQRS